jgi:hypothetical protein
MRLHRAVLSCACAALLACSPENSDSAGRDAPSPAATIVDRPSPLPCGDSRVLHGSGIGLFVVGIGVDSLARACSVLRDTTELGAEGMPERRIIVQLGVDSVYATIDSGRVWRIEVTSERFRTADGFGVGTYAREFAARRASIAVGEGVFIVSDAHCGMSFGIDGVELYPSPRIDSLPATSRVASVLIYGCTSRSGPT